MTGSHRRFILRQALKYVAIAASLLLLAVITWRPLQLSYQHYALRDMFVTQPGAQLGVGPATGSQFPGLQAEDGLGRVTLLQRHAGERGTVLVILQSVEHSPHCAEQLRQLQHYRAQFSARGIALVALTQDTRDAVAIFARQNGIDLPVLTDNAGLSAKTLGLLGRGGTPGVPLPGALLIDGNNRVVDKVFLPDPLRRIDAATLLSRAESTLLEEPAAAAP